VNFFFFAPIDLLVVIKITLGW